MGPLYAPDRLTNWFKNQFSLDAPEQDLISPESAGDFAVGMVPGVGQAMAVRDIARGIKAKDPTQTALAAAGLVPFGSLVGKLRNPIKRIIAGDKAVHFPKEKAQEAMYELGAGANKSDVWRTHGIEKTAEGHPSFEISDTGTKITLDHPDWQQMGNMDYFQGELAHVFPHPELYKNYPDIAKSKVTITIDPTRRKGAEGGFYPDTGELEVTARSRKQARLALIHEIQHKVQKEQGWEGGANTREMEDAISSMKQNLGIPPATSDQELAWEMYLRNMGENQAEIPRIRANMSPELRALVRPEHNAPFTYAPEPGDLRGRLHALDIPETAYELDNILRKLRKP
jgi:hypothetical protein